MPLAQSLVLANSRKMDCGSILYRFTYIYKMKRLQVLTVLFFLSLFPFILIAQEKGSDTPWFFIQLSDPQFGMFEKNEGFAKETVLYEKAVAEINRLKPVCHYPIFIKTLEEAENYSNFSLEKRQKYLVLFEEEDVRAVFAGHLHN